MYSHDLGQGEKNASFLLGKKIPCQVETHKASTTFKWPCLAKQGRARIAGISIDHGLYSWMRLFLESYGRGSPCPVDARCNPESAGGAVYFNNQHTSAPKFILCSDLRDESLQPYLALAVSRINVEFLAWKKLEDRLCFLSKSLEIDSYEKWMCNDCRRNPAWVHTFVCFC